MNKNLEKDVTILVCSCDKYEDAWDPFFKLLKIQWPECKCKLALMTEGKEYNCDFLDVKSIYPKNKLTWSQRFKDALNKIDTKYVVFILEDYFILNPVNSTVFDKAVNIMNDNNNVGMISLSQTNRKNIKTNEYGDKNFYSRIIDKDCKIWCRPTLYRKDYLLKILRDHESIWEFEGFASYRAKKLDYIILQQNNNDNEIITFKIRVEDGIGITLGKWLPKNKELFKKYSIDVNFDRLGFLYPESPNKATSNTLSGENEKMNIREVLYSIKHMFKLIKKYIRKKYREYLSKR